MQRIVPVSNCTGCGNVRTYSTTACRLCGTPYPPSDLRGRAQSSANLKQLGTCPKCSSSIHYETSKKTVWCCADCNTEYRAPKRVGEVGDDE
jgi:RNase P subunit RPR2